MRRPRPTTTEPVLGSVALAVVLGLAVAGGPVLAAGPAAASYHGAPTPAPAVGNHLGELTVVDAFLPQPPSPDVAAIYLTVRNAGSRPDALVSVSSSAAVSSMLMSENPDGTMGMLQELRVPAHGQASLVPGKDHLMLERPYDALVIGQHVLVTLRFQRAGALTVSVPVVPFSRILEHGRT
jgi:copper(I)-binding protein